LNKTESISKLNNCLDSIFDICNVSNIGIYLKTTNRISKKSVVEFVDLDTGEIIHIRYGEFARWMRRQHIISE
tara:strand:+ start:85 stop:303 length:219 start_codon:yes stop_codon:yes gene_type:complete